MNEKFKTLLKEESTDQRLQKDIAESYEETQDGQLRHRNGGNRSKKMVRERPECPSCGLPMKLKRGDYGLFYGCPRYPMCKYTLPVF